MVYGSNPVGWVDVEVSGFVAPFGAVNKRRGLWVRPRELARAACVSGFTRLRQANLTDVVVRTQIADLVMDSVHVAGHILQFMPSSRPWPAEFLKTRSALIGYGMAKLFTERALHLQYGIAVEHFQKLTNPGILFDPSGLRPDLLVYDRRYSWHVIEAKGRKSFSKKVRQRAKKQARAIRSIRGAPPRTTSYMLTRLRTRMSLLVKDPPVMRNQQREESPADWNDLWRHYYGWCVELLVRARTQKALAQPLRDGNAYSIPEEAPTNPLGRLSLSIKRGLGPPSWEPL